MNHNINQQYFYQRLKQVADLLEQLHLDALLITSPENISYLSGLTGLSHYEREAFLVLTAHSQVLLLSAFTNCDDVPNSALEVQIISKEHRVTQLLNTLGPSPLHLGIESSNLTVSELEGLKAVINISRVEDISVALSQIRVQKDKLEQKRIAKACEISGKSWPIIKKAIKIGVSEVEVANLVKDIQLGLGATNMPHGFEPIVAFGSHSAIAHHKPTTRKLRANQPVLVDYGCSYQGYASDMTRCFFFGQSSPKYRKHYDLVIKAYQTGVNQVKQSDEISLVDQAIRHVFVDANVADNYIHTSGHGLGLSVHEPPSIYHTNKDKLLDHTVFTIEPGLYFVGKYGIRHEDTFIFSQQKVKNLTQPQEKTQLDYDH